MIRSELMQKIAEANPDFTQREIEAIVATFFGEITDRLAADGRVELRGSALFQPVRARRATVAIRAPAKPLPSTQNGCPISSPARKCASA